jgi:hypothetical protein
VVSRLSRWKPPSRVGRHRAFGIAPEGSRKARFHDSTSQEAKDAGCLGLCIVYCRFTEIFLDSFAMLFL